MPSEELEASLAKRLGLGLDALKSLRDKWVDPQKFYDKKGRDIWFMGAGAEQVLNELGLQNGPALPPAREPAPTQAFMVAKLVLNSHLD